jgi:uncharacterized protein YegP (UPF0339 family)
MTNEETKRINRNKKDKGAWYLGGTNGKGFFQIEGYDVLASCRQSISYIRCNETLCRKGEPEVNCYVR